MDPTIRQVRSFIAVARAGSFTRAARALGLSQPALTVQIRQLEQALQVRLLDRNTRSVHLTRIGKGLIPPFERLLRELDALVGDVREQATGQFGTVRMASLPSLAATLLPEAIAAFRRKHPRVQFVLKDGVGGKVANLVRTDAVDFGISGGVTPDPELEAHTLMCDCIHAVYLSPHALDRQSAITMERLAAHPLIVMDEESTVREVVEDAFRQAGQSINVAIEATYMSTAVGMARAGLGVALLPSTAVEAKPSGKLRSRPVSDKRFLRPISIVRKKGRALPPVTEEFLASLMRHRVVG